MSKLAYERPTIIKHAAGMGSKVGRGLARRTLPRIDGVRVSDLVAKFGSPLFVFSETRLRQKVKGALRTFSLRYPKVAFAWSYKTNYLDAICRIHHQEGSLAEVVSEMEYEMARRIGVNGPNIIFNGPHKPESALRRAFEDGARVHLDHYEELYLAEKIAATMSKKVKIGIRVNLDAGIFPRWDRFGFNLDNGEAMEAVRRIQSGGELELTGVHCHLGTFVLDPEAYGQAAAKMAAFARDILSETGFQIEYLDLGGGFASRNTLHDQYNPGTDGTPPIEDYAEALTNALVDEFGGASKTPSLILELGRVLIDEAGFLIARVLGSKRLADGRRAVILDAGVNTLFTAFWYRHELLPEIDRGGMLEEATVYGPLCMNIDVVRPSVLLPPMEPQDAVVIRPVGAYNVTQWMQFIHLRPPVVLISEKGELEIIRRGETVDDIKGPEQVPKRLA